VSDMEKMLMMQMRWYGARFILDTLVILPIEAAKAMVGYAVVLDDTRASMERWLVMGGATRDSIKGQSDAIMDAIRKVSISMPISTKDIGAATEPFVGAGLGANVIAELVPSITKLKSAFKEIDMNQFALSIVGAFNVFKDKLGEGLTDAEKLRKLMDQIMSASAVSVIRPENFTKVIQYLGQIGDIAGFASEDLFAMASALVNLSIPAANASRLLAGVFTNIATTKTIDQLNLLGKQVGFQIDKTKNLKEQWMDILELLNKLMASGVNLEKIEFLKGLVPGDRLKTLLGLAQNIAEIKKVLASIRGGEGKGLDLAAEVAKAPLSAQWIIFKNILNEVGVSLGAAGGSLQRFMVTVVDVSRGILVAVDPTGKFKEQLNELGPAGSKAHDTMVGLRGVLSKLIDVLYPFGLALGGVINGWIKLASVFTQNKEIFELVLNTLLGLGVVALGTFASKLITTAGAASKFATLLLPVGEALKLITPWLITMGEVLLVVGQNLARFLLILISGQWKLFAVLFTDIGLSVAGISTAFSTLGATLLRFLSSPAALLIIGLEAISFAFKQLNAEMDKMDAKDKALRGTKYTKESIGSAIKGKVAELSKFTQEDILRRPEEYNELRNDLAFLRGQERALNTPVVQAKTGSGLKTSKGAPKLASVGGSLLSSTDKFYKSVETIETSFYEREQKLLKDNYAEGKITLKDYYDSSSMWLENWVSVSLGALDRWDAESKKAFARQRVEAAAKKTGGPDAVAAVNQAEIAHQEQLEAKRTAILTKGSNERSALEKNRLTDSFALQKMSAEQEANLQKQKNEQIENAEKESIERRKALLASLYDNQEISATYYYDTERKILEDTAAMNKRKINEDTDAKLSAINLELLALEAAQQTEGKKYQELSDKYTLTEEQRATKTLEINEDLNTKLYTMQLKMLKDIQLIYEENGSGLYGMLLAFKESLSQITNMLPTWGAQIKGFTQSITQGIQTATSTFVFDWIKGQTKSMADYVLMIIESMAKKISDVMADLAVELLFGNKKNGTQGGLGGLLGGIDWANMFGDSGEIAVGSSWADTFGSGFSSALGFHKGGVVGKSSPTFMRAVPSGIFAGAPRLHKGLASDEFPAILQDGETIFPKGTKKGASPTEGNQATINHFYIQAMDSKSFDEFIRRNPGPIVKAATQSLKDNKTRNEWKGLLK